MTTESEQALENKLIAQLEILGFEQVHIKDEKDLIENLKNQLEKHNKTTFSDQEFKQVLNKLARGNIFERAKILRDKVDYTREDGTTRCLELIDQIWCSPHKIVQDVCENGMINPCSGEEEAWYVSVIRWSR